MDQLASTPNLSNRTRPPSESVPQWVTPAGSGVQLDHQPQRGSLQAVLLSFPAPHIPSLTNILLAWVRPVLLSLHSLYLEHISSDLDPSYLGARSRSGPNTQIGLDPISPFFWIVSSFRKQLQSSERKETHFSTYFFICKMNTFLFICLVEQKLDWSACGARKVQFWYSFD